jgi:hypothetical protein
MNLDEMESKLNEFKEILSSNKGKPLNEFSDAVYLSVVEKVIIGKKDEQGKTDPYHITFVFKKPFDNDMEVPTTEVVSDNEPISPLVNNATFSQHALNDCATKSDSLTRGDGRCFRFEEVVRCPVGNMLMTLDVLRIKSFCSKI